MNTRPVALITGAAGGLGAVLATELAAAGYDLALTDVATCASPASPVTAEVFTGDLADLSFTLSLAQRVVDRFGRIDLLVNNAAWRELVTLREITVESWEKTLRVCLTAPAMLAREAAARMARNSPAGGVIINVSSIMSARASGVAPAYVAAKGAIEALTADLAVLYGPSGVRVVAVAPGAIDAPAGRDYGASQDQLRAHSEQMIPLGRWADPAEVARAIAWLAGPGASYITGTTVTIDGGFSRQLHPRHLLPHLNTGAGR